MRFAHSGRFAVWVLMIIILGSRSAQRRSSAWMLLAALLGTDAVSPANRAAITMS